MNKKVIYITVSMIFLAGGILGFNYYQKIFGKSVTKNGVIYIKSNSKLADVEKSLSEFVDNPEKFSWIAEKKKFNNPKGGKYTITKGMSMNNLVNLLRSGNQTPIKIAFNNQDSLERLAGRIAQQIEADSTTILNAMTDSTFLVSKGFNKNSALGMYIPNSYEFYWNTSAKKFRNKMLDEYNKFWNNSRLEKAKKQKLTRQQVITLASIVHKETVQKSERPTVAGLYLNRLNNKWPLEADPTIIYAKQQEDKNIIIKRVLFKYIEDTKDSPYNTYKNGGLPPSLIAMPDISAIDAVLNPKKHNYYFMCASINKIGFHDFTNSLTQHNINAAKYQHWISKKGIKK